jgi:hypothetical protein
VVLGETVAEVEKLPPQNIWCVGLVNAVVKVNFDLAQPRTLQVRECV